MVGACYLAYLFKERAKHLSTKIGKLEYEVHYIATGLGLDKHISPMGGMRVAIFTPGEEYKNKILGIIGRSMVSKDPRIDHLINTSPELFFKRFATREVEVTRVTSDGEQIINGYLSSIESSVIGGTVFHVIYSEGNTVKDTRIKHSEIINFKFFDK